MASNEPAVPKPTNPNNVNTVASTNENAQGFRSVYSPTIGCSNDAVTWHTKVIMPT